MDNITKLCAWFSRQCVDGWHEDCGVKIDTLDNPGWSIKIDLKNTNMEHEKFQEVKIDRSDSDWIFARRNGDVFEAFGGVMNLGEMIEKFLIWAE
ncbi:MAG: immunity 53 family protein [Pseudomonadales bacterium]|jgi:hypothetical protein|nr:immunity 53 family protein [Pseudomonadales bacterium]